MFAGTRGTARGRSRSTRRPSPSPSASPPRIRAIPNGSAMSRLATTTSAMSAWRGATARGSEIYQKALAIAERLAAQDPGNTEWQRDVSVSYNKIGDVRLEGGDRKGALEIYQKALAIAERLAAQDPGNTEWQRDVSVSYNKIGDVRLEGGDRKGHPRDLREGPGHRRAPRRPGSGQCRMAARCLGELQQNRRCPAERATARGPSRPTRRPWSSPSASP